MKIIQILGNNGAGKSALVRAVVNGGSERSAQMTWVPELRALVVGEYGPSPRTGKPLSLENQYHTKAEFLAALDAARAAAESLGASALLWEAIILMTRQYHSEYLARGLTPVYVWLDTPLTLCLQRIEARGGKPVGRAKTPLGRERFILRLVTWLTERAPVHRLDGEAPIEENVRRLRRVIGAI